MAQYNEKYFRDVAREKAYENIRTVLDTVTTSNRTKSLNLFWANLKLQEVIKELQEEKGRSEHLNEAIDFIMLAQEKLKDYSNDLRQKLDDTEPE